MKRTFHIQRDPAAATNGDVLLCEFSQHHVSTALADASSKTVQQISYYELKSGLLPDTLQHILNTESGGPDAIRRVVLSNALKETVLVPALHFTEADATQFYAGQYGRNTGSLYFDAVPSYDLVVVHAVPAALLQPFKNIPETHTTHCYTCLLPALKEVAAASIAVYFTGKEIRVAAQKEGQLRLAQTYPYSAPLDVVYYLLAICQQYGLGQDDTALVLSGLVSQDSAMYNELYQYFSNIHFWQPATKNTLQSEYPVHFFSSVYNLAACAL